jgi:mRNA interferase HicA
VRRRELVRHLEENGCRELREGSRHTMYVNPRQRKVSAVPRHTEINDVLARKICRDLKTPEPS